MKIKASVSVTLFLEVEMEVPEGVEPDVIGAQARAVASTIPLSLNIKGELPSGCRISDLTEDGEREHINWGEV